MDFLKYSILYIMAKCRSLLDKASWLQGSLQMTFILLTALYHFRYINFVLGSCNFYLDNIDQEQVVQLALRSLVLYHCRNLLPSYPDDENKLHKCVNLCINSFYFIIPHPYLICTCVRQNLSIYFFFGQAIFQADSCNPRSDCIVQSIRIFSFDIYIN